MGYEDFWWRFEWQLRGSGRLHCLVWIKTAPTYECGNGRNMGPLCTGVNESRLDELRPMPDATCFEGFEIDQFAAFVNRFQIRKSAKHHTYCPNLTSASLCVDDTVPYSKRTPPHQSVDSALCRS